MRIEEGEIVDKKDIDGEEEELKFLRKIEKERKMVKKKWKFSKGKIGVEKKKGILSKERLKIEEIKLVEKMRSEEIMKENGEV